MGLFDTVHVPCPNCGKSAAFQSKGGDCGLSNYTLEDAPADVLSDVDATVQDPYRCECGIYFAIDRRWDARVLVVTPGTWPPRRLVLTPEMSVPAEFEVDGHCYCRPCALRLLEEIDDLGAANPGDRCDECIFISEELLRAHTESAV